MDLYHVCISSSELIYRVEADYVEGINRFVISGLRTNTTVLAYALMSNHIHIIIKTREVAKFVESYRTGYNKWFNNKYGRRGRLGDKNYFAVKLEIHSHIIAALTYVLKNGVHHNLVKYPNEYQFSSSKYCFMKEFGIKHLYTELESQSMIRKFASYRVNIPANIKADSSGMFIPESFREIDIVEKYYDSVRQFAFQMNQLMPEEWAVTNIEAWRKGIIPKKKILQISDMEICTILDPALAKQNVSYTELSLSMKQSISHMYIVTYGATASQMKRCMAISNKQHRQV